MCAGSLSIDPSSKYARYLHSLLQCHVSSATYLHWRCPYALPLQVPGDQNIQYIFTTDIVVTYNNDGQRKRDVEQRTFRLRDAAADITADTQALIGAGLDTSSTSTTSLATSSAACAFLVSVLAAALLCVV